MNKDLIICPKSSLFTWQAQQIARQLSVPLSMPPLKNQPALFLQVGPQGLELIKRDTRQQAVRVNFSSGTLGYRHRHGGFRQAIARAVGARHKEDKGRTLKILDATAGFGADAFILASLRCEVVMLESSVVVALLLADGLRRATTDPAIAATIARMQLHTIRFQDYAQSCQAQAFDVVYLDPMFPTKKKNAAAKKEIQLLKQIAYLETEQSSLLQLALRIAHSRVVVKRPKHACFLDEKSPNFQIMGQSTRFDVYTLS